jgi:hypothetical protein
MYTVIPIVIIFGLLILLPPVAVWLSVSRQVSGRAAWFRFALASIGPFIAAFIFVVLVWLPAYSGQCGGWLGETTPCSFEEYATETMYWAAISMALPAFKGMLLAVVVMLAVLLRRKKTRPA